MSAPIPWTTPVAGYTQLIILRETRRSRFASRGGRFIMPRSGASYANMMPGTMSVPRSMNSTVIGPSGSGNRRKSHTRNATNSDMFDVRMYAIDFFRLSKSARPSSIPETIVAKLSSSKTYIQTYLIVFSQSSQIIQYRNYSTGTWHRYLNRLNFDVCN